MNKPHRFWPNFWNSMGLGALWRWLACRVGLHRWWHLATGNGVDWIDVCRTCGRRRKAKAVD